MNSKVEMLDVNPGEKIQRPNCKTGNLMKTSLLITMLVFLMILCILSSLGVGLFYLVKDQGKTKRTVRALTIRITLSFILFIALFLAFALGLIEPHPLFGL